METVSTEEKIIDIVKDASVHLDALLLQFQKLHEMEAEITALSVEERNKLSDRPEVLEFEEKVNKVLPYLDC